MIFRSLAPLLEEASKKYPVITLTGPRQSGKTTLCRQVFKDLPYISLEDPDRRLEAQNDARGLLSSLPQGAVLDEIQRAPDLTSYIQTLVDEPNNQRLFVLTGSQNLSISQTVSQSLAGRTALFRLFPFTMNEIRDQISQNSLDQLLMTGFFPRIYDKHLPPTQTLADYYETYVERDIRALSNIHDLNLFQKFVRLCAGRIGQILNLSSLGNEVGVSGETIRQWLTLLQATYIVYLLPPYYKNFNKRHIKRPKLYFYDTGLAAYLLGISTPEQMSRDPLKGNLFENLVIIDILKTYAHHGRPNLFYFFRDNNENEVDLLWETAGNICPVEIKSAQTLHSDFLRGLRFMQKIGGKNIIHPQIIYGGDETKPWMQITARSYKDCLSILKLCP